MKSILLISRCTPYPLHFGDRLIVWHLSRQLAKRGHQIDLLALYDRDSDTRFVEEYRAFYRHIELLREAPRPTLSLMRRLLLPSARFASQPERSFSPALWHAIDRRLRTQDYDIAHCFGAISVYEYHPLFAHLPNLITPYESHSLYLRSAIKRGEAGARLRLPVARSFERFMFQPYGRTVVIADDDRQELQSLQPALKVDLIPNGIELDSFGWNSAGRAEDVLLFVGNFAYAPNQDAARLLVDQIMPAIWRERPEVRLQLVGVHPTDWMRRLTDARIEVTGRVPAVQPYLARATAFVCPLRLGAGLKNKVLEALAAGIPLLATPLSLAGIDCVDGESALIREADQLADGALMLLRDSDLRRRLSIKGRELIEARYTWSRVAQAYERLYDELIGG